MYREKGASSDIIDVCQCGEVRVKLGQEGSRFVTMSHVTKKRDLLLLVTKVVRRLGA